MPDIDGDAQFCRIAFRGRRLRGLFGGGLLGRLLFRDVRLRGAGFCVLSLESLPLNRFDSQPASLTPAGNSADTTNAAMSVRRTAGIPLSNGKSYSAAAIRGRPTKPAASPKRSTITAGRSLALLVTQAPERTA